jgi:hypothetical protein
MLAADARRNERESRRELRELIRAQKEAEKRSELHAAAAAVRHYEVLLIVLTTVHRECGPFVDWRQLAAWTPPSPPRDRYHADAAQGVLESYRPGLVARMFGGATKTRAQLELAVARAHEEDVRLRAHYDEMCRQANEARRIAEAVLSGDTRAYSAALECAGAFDELTEYGVAIDVVTIAGMTNAIRLELRVEERKVVPQEQKGLTKAGKLTTTNMPKAQGNEIYQDYGCGAALRAAHEAFAALSPVNLILVTVRTDILNTKTGHIESTPVLSFMLPRATCEGINWSAVDASDAISNFVNRMSFKRGAGMAAIGPLTNDELQASVSFGA